MFKKLKNLFCKKKCKNGASDKKPFKLPSEFLSKEEKDEGNNS